VARKLTYRRRRGSGLGRFGAGLILLAGCGSQSGERVVVGSKNFTEQLVLGELVAQQIEARTELEVERRLNLGGTLICHRAILAGQIDLYVEYTGTALTAILHQPPSQDAAAVFDQVAKAYERLGLVWMAPLGFNNTFAIVVRGADARRLELETISDAAAHAPAWRAGFGYEFMERADGFRGLAQSYGLEFRAPPRTMELGLLYRALKERQVDLVAGNSTDGVIAELDLVVLEDDRGYFPVYEAAVVVRRDTLTRHPALEAALEQLAGRLDEDRMRAMNRAVDSQQRGLQEVAQRFLESEVAR
jgi:glycine betaine/choline ABC-type transport system substrate-binding protein